MNENIKNIISSRIKYHSNKQKYGYFMGNECIDICASDILDDVINAGYRKQSETVKEIIKKILAFSYYIKFEDTNGKDREELVVYESKIKQIAEQFGKEEI